LIGAMTMYPGVDAHLNSILQIPGSDDQPSLWTAFHAAHITYIAGYLNEVLPQNYRALTEQSLQVRQQVGDREAQGQRRPDVVVFESTLSTESSIAMTGTTPTLELSLSEIMEPDEWHPAVVIRNHGQVFSGKVVARIELLSPANMPGGSYTSGYKRGRTEAIQSGVPLVEIDYLHEFPPIIDRVPHYPNDKGSTAYMVAVTDPRPAWYKGHVRIFGFGLADPMPKIIVPLADEESVLLDMKSVYDETLTRGGRWQDGIDYSQPPSRFETYSPADQEAIRTVMKELSL
jgi:hypothetical protein